MSPWWRQKCSCDQCYINSARALKSSPRDVTWDKVVSVDTMKAYGEEEVKSQAFWILVYHPVEWSAPRICRVGFRKGYQITSGAPQPFRTLMGESPFERIHESFCCSTRNQVTMPAELLSLSLCKIFHSRTVNRGSRDISVGIATRQRLRWSSG
jgi:hypothetical protein